VARALEKIAAAEKDVPGRVLVHADEHLADQRALLEAAGFTLVRWFLEMTRPLDGEVPDVALEPPLRLVPYTPDLSEAVRAAHNEAFADHWGSEPRAREEWERATVGGRTFRPGWSFVVLDGEEVAGYALSSAYEQDWAAQGYTAGWTDLLGVRRAWRHRGVARALLAASMRAFAADGMERADLGVDSENLSGALALYTGLGYRPAHRTTAYAKDV
jgi:mycothiol synthase